jgi:hypothetical protein
MLLTLSARDSRAGNAGKFSTGAVRRCASRFEVEVVTSSEHRSSALWVRVLRRWLMQEDALDIEGRFNGLFCHRI